MRSDVRQRLQANADFHQDVARQFAPEEEKLDELASEALPSEAEDDLADGQSRKRSARRKAAEEEPRELSHDEKIAAMHAGAARELNSLLTEARAEANATIQQARDAFPRRDARAVRPPPREALPGDTRPVRTGPLRPVAR